MKVLVVNTVPTERNGITGVIFNYLEALKLDMDDNIDLVSINNPEAYFKNRLKKLGIKLYIAPRNIKNPIRYIAQLNTIAKGYDIIHVHGNSATMTLEMIAAKLAKVPLLICHSHNTSCTLKIIDKICRPLFYHLCNARVACGEEAGKWLFKSRPFKVLNNGIDTARFSYDATNRNQIRTKFNLDESCILFGHIGNFVEAKNHLFLIDVFASIKKKHSSVKLLLLGSGDGMDPVKEKVDDLNLQENVIFGGSVDHPQDYLSAIDLVIMPSLFEGLPLTLVEEQANGLKCIVSDTITKEVDMTGNISFLPLTDSTDTWANEALRLVDKSEQNRISMSHLAIEKIKAHGFDIHQNANDLKDYYHKQLAKSLKSKC